jgi:DNA-binding response OmpR family regulator
MDEKNKKQILLVEDDIALAEMYQDKFVLEGFHVYVSRNGVDGLEAALRIKPDLILLDILLPGMDGMTVMKKLRTDVWGKTVPIIMLTNLNANDTILKGVVEDHPAYYLMKANSEPAEVVGKVKDVLKEI